MHVAVTRDTSTGQKQLYVNGALNATNFNGGNGPLNANPMIAFGSNPLDNRYFNGQLDDIYFYNRVLSPAEILDVMGLLANDCKDGAWQSYRNADGSQTFKNQGDCVSWVATGGKNPPAGR